MKPRDAKARIVELEQLLDFERAAYDELLTDYQRLERESVAAKAEMQRMRAEAQQGRSIPRRREVAA